MLNKPLKDICLITSCVSSKSTPPMALGKDIPNNINMEEGATYWAEVLKSYEATHTPSELYRGMSFTTLARITNMYIPSKNTYIMSGAYGLVNLQDKMVSYDFTSDPKHPDTVINKFTKEPFINTIWWRLLNEKLHNTPNPIADILNMSQFKLVVLACNSRTYKFMTEDILSSEHIDKVRIITTGLSGPGIATQLRPYTVHIGREHLHNTIGNRNDPNHRAALIYFGMLEANPELIDKPASMQVPASVSSAATTTTNIHPRIKRSEIEGLIKKHVDILEDLDVQQGFNVLKKIYGSIGGRQGFKAAWRKASGEFDQMASAKVNDKALEALGMIGDSLDKNLSKGSSWSEETAALDMMRVFIATLKQANPDATFSAREIYKWVAIYAGDGIPAALKTTVKIGQLLRAYYKELQLEMSHGGIGEGIQYYKLATVTKKKPS